MLIINADDLALNRVNTDNIIQCFLGGGLTSATFMVFKEDSERAGELAQAHDLPTGLHLNIHDPFVRPGLSPNLVRHQEQLARWFRGPRYHRHLYNPLIQKSLAYSFQAQVEEYERLFGQPPDHVDGHHYLHLNPTILVGQIYPAGFKVRPKLTNWPVNGFLSGLYRNVMNRWARRRYRLPDYCFEVGSYVDGVMNMVRYAVALAADNAVEFMVHLEDDQELIFLLGDEFQAAIRDAIKGSYRDL